MNQPVFLPEPKGKPSKNLSYSQANSFLTCGEQYRLEKIFRVPQPPSLALVFGSALHTGTELIDYASLGRLVPIAQHNPCRCPVIDLGERAKGKSPQPEQDTGSCAGSSSAVQGYEAETCDSTCSAVNEVPEGFRRDMASPEQQQDNGETRTVSPEQCAAAQLCWDADIDEDRLHAATELSNSLIAEAVAEEVRRRPDYPDPSTWKVSGRKTKDLPNKEDWDHWVKTLPIMLVRYVQWRKTSDWELAMVNDRVPAIELDVTFDIGDVPVSGRLDRVFLAPRQGSGSIPITVDIKTSSRVPASGEQMGLYGVQLEQLGFDKPQFAAFWMARTGELSELFDVSKYELDYFKMKYRAIQSQKEAGVFLPNLDSPFCNSCSVKDYCWAKGGEYANMIPRPWDDPFGESLIDSLDTTSEVASG